PAEADRGRHAGLPSCNAFPGGPGSLAVAFGGAELYQRRKSVMTEPDQYILGYRHAEQERLQQQAQQLADESSWLFDQIGVSAGARVVEIGCGPHGCLELLAERVGTSGSVVGIERSPDAVDLARKMVNERGLQNVEVLCRDARSPDLPRAAFDF